MKAYRRLAMNEGEAMPAHRPYYPSLPAYYRGAEFQIIYFRADAAAIQQHLPEPLIADPAGLAAAFSLRVPFCSAYGPYCEVGLRLRCSFRGQMGFYSSHQYIDNVAALCAGRERWGGPKAFAGIAIERQGNLIRAQAVQNGIALMSLTSTAVVPAQAGEMIPMTPSYRLKMIPRADGPGAAIKQIITYVAHAAQTDLLLKGDGMVEMGASAQDDLTPLNPIAMEGAFFQVVTLVEGYGVIAYDYLAEQVIA